MTCVTPKNETENAFKSYLLVLFLGKTEVFVAAF